MYTQKLNNSFFVCLVHCFRTLARSCLPGNSFNHLAQKKRDCSICFCLYVRPYFRRCSKQATTLHLFTTINASSSYITAKKLVIFCVAAFVGAAHVTNYFSCVSSSDVTVAFTKSKHSGSREDYKIQMLTVNHLCKNQLLTVTLEILDGKDALPVSFKTKR